MIANPKPRTIRSPRFLAWLRSLPCSWCSRRSPSEASHHGRHGIAIKPPDTSAIPLCSRCHALTHASLTRANAAELARRFGAPVEVTARGIREWAATVAAKLVERFAAEGRRL